MSIRSINKPPSSLPPKRLNPGNRKMRYGYMTVVMHKGVEMAIFHSDITMLERAFNELTEGRQVFDLAMVSVVQIINLAGGGKK